MKNLSVYVLFPSGKFIIYGLVIVPTGKAPGPHFREVSVLSKRAYV